MDMLIFSLICYFSAGIVFIMREADLQIIGHDSTTPHIQHPVLRLTAGMIMLMLWPAFLLGEMFDQHQSPMAVRIENFK